MIRAIALALLGSVSTIGIADAAVQITHDDQGSTFIEVFDDQVYYGLVDGQLNMRIDLNRNLCSMFLHEHRVHLQGNCDETRRDIEAALEEAMTRQGISREQLLAMRQMMKRDDAPADAREVGDETIAGYAATCYQVATRTLCVSAAVAALVNREFAFTRAVELMQQMASGPFGGEPTGAEQLELKIRKRGYVMKDVDTRQGMPNAAILQALPEEARRQMMEQLRQSGAAPVGRTVVKVEEDVQFTPHEPQYPTRSIREFARHMMGQ